MPDGNTSVMISVVAAAVPAFEYDNVTVIGAAEGEAPLLTLNALVTFNTDDWTVVVSVFEALLLPVSATGTVTVPVVPAVADAGIVAATTKLNWSPAPSCGVPPTWRSACVLC